jgi:hypothetical protein
MKRSEFIEMLMEELPKEDPEIVLINEVKEIEVLSCYPSLPDKGKKQKIYLDLTS